MSGRRHQAREVVLQLLYQFDLNPDTSLASVREHIAEELADESLKQFAWELLMGVNERRVALDAQITAVAANWAVSRMPVTDRNAIRLGAYELIHTDTPAGIVIDEALELAKSFGGANSVGFVNGILDRLIPAEKRVRRAERTAEAAPATED
jgi:transcription antitermination protein NusB